MTDSLEDRIYASGKGDEFTKAYDKFMESDRSNRDQQDFYDKLEQLGASPEEADEFVNLVMED